MTKTENSIIDLFNENDIEEASLKFSNPNSEERSSEFQYCQDTFLREEVGGWFNAVCDRHTCRTSATIHSQIPNLSNASSSSSSVFLSGSSLSSFDGIFNSTPLHLYDCPNEILDWADWLATVCVSDEDKKHVDLCLEGHIPIPHKKDSTIIRNGFLRGIQLRERNIREDALREKKKEIDLKNSLKVMEVDNDGDNDDDDDYDDDDDDDDDDNQDEDKVGDDDDNDHDEEDEEEEDEDEEYAGKYNRAPDTLPSRSSSRKRKADLE